MHENKLVVVELDLYFWACEHKTLLWSSLSTGIWVVTINIGKLLNNECFKIKNKITNDSAENLDESSPVNVATKIIVPSKKKDQQQMSHILSLI